MNHFWFGTIYYYNTLTWPAAAVSPQWPPPAAIGRRGGRRGGSAASQTTKDTVSHGNESSSLNIEACRYLFPR